MNKKNYTFVKSDGVLKKVLFSDIIYLLSDRDYCKVFTLRKMFYIHATMKILINVLPKDSFIQCNRSTIVNIDNIETITHKSIQINQDVIIPISNTFKYKFFKNINCLMTGYEARAMNKKN